MEEQDEIGLNCADTGGGFDSGCRRFANGSL